MSARRMKAEEGDGGRPTLSRESIIEAALEIIDNEGYDKLSMRRLGATLKVDPMAIYYYFPNKSALLDGIVTQVMSYIDIASDNPAAPPEDRIYNAASQYREALLRHPGVLTYIVSRRPSDAVALRPVEVLLGMFREAGFSPPEALNAVNIFAAYVQGESIRTAAGHGMTDVEQQESVEAEQLLASLPPEEFPNFIAACSQWQFCGYEAQFEHGARALIRGLLETYGDEKSTKSKNSNKSSKGKSSKSTVNSGKKG